MNGVFLVGVGMTAFGKFEDLSVKALTRTALDRVLADAGCGPEAIEAAFFANATQGVLEGQNSIRGQIALGAAGLNGIPIVNLDNACASGGTAFYLACAHVSSGLSDVVLALGCEKMYSTSKEKTFSVFNGGWDVQEVPRIVARLNTLGDGIFPTTGMGESEPKSAFLDIYAALAKFHMKIYGLTERQLAAVAAKNHCHSVHNPFSQYRVAMTVDEVLAARRVAWPLTLPMCSPISDGAAAVIVCNEQGLRRFEKRRGIRVLASVLASSSDREGADLDRHVTRLAAARAYEQAGVGPNEMSLAEVHDATAFGEILQSECLGFCALGEGGQLAESGATRLGGRIPINVSGGLESKGHPVGATGLAQLAELVIQLRAEAGLRQVRGARMAIAENGGGFHGVEEAAACVTILAA